MKSILLLLTISFSLSAQVKGVVKDSISGKPIEYVGVFTSKTENNFSTDKNGKFKVENLTQQDTLWFFTTGYKEKKVALKSLSNTVYLEPISNSSKDKNVDLYTQKKQWINLQTNNTLKTFSASSTNLKAYFIKGIDATYQSILIEKLSFKTVNLTQKDNVFKIRFFKADSLQNIAEEILTEPIIVEIKTSKTKGSNNVYNLNSFSEIEVLDQKIEIQKEGLFIAIESINIKENQFKSVYNKSSSILISPSIGISNIETKVYSYVKGKWQKLEKSNYFPDFKISIATTQN